MARGKCAKIKAALIDDDILNCKIIEDVLKDYSRIHLLGYCTQVGAFKAQIKKCKPDVALIDIGLGTGTEGMDILKWLQKSHPGIRPVMITIHSEHASKCYSLGARGYVIKGHWEELGPTIIRVYKGETIVPMKTAPFLVGQIRNLEACVSLQSEKDMTKRELSIVAELLKGRKNREAARALEISYFTFKRHLQNLRTKYRVSTTRELLHKIGAKLR